MTSWASHIRPVRIANRRTSSWYVRGPLAGLCAVLVALPQVVLIAGFLIVRDYAKGLPRAPNLTRWSETQPQTSVIRAADGTVVAELPFHSGDVIGHRSVVRYADIPETLRNAILSAEDSRFFSHRGVDFYAVARAALANYRAGRVVQGASTITQQVARNLLPRQIGYKRSLRRKVREALLARRIERHYNKQQIFEVYANHVFLGATAYGVAAAAHLYFSKRLSELNLVESALIAGLIQAPSRLDPLRHRDAARDRRNEVLRRMRRNNFIDDAALQRALAQPVELHPRQIRYGRVAPWHTETARQQVREQFPGAYAHGGLTIETSARLGLANQAQALAARTSAKLSRPEHKRKGDTTTDGPQIGGVVWDYRTGYVEAVVGGLSWGKSQFDRAGQACRQPGSAFKPILYAAAIADDIITPGTPLRDAPIAEYDARLNVHWKPHNSGHPFRGVALAKDALAFSLNAPAVDVLDRTGVRRVRRMAKRLGISTHLANVRPMALGASCVIPFELARAFSAFARGGSLADAIYVTRIKVGDRVLVDRAAPRDPNITPGRRLDRLVASLDTAPKRVLDEQSAFLVTTMLRDVVLRGTGTLAKKLGRPAAGKTGTTNKNTDAWFVGFTGRVVAAVWLGYDDQSRRMGYHDDGGKVALPVWMGLVAASEGAKRPPQPVPGPAPSGVVSARVDRETGLLARPGAGGAESIYFRDGTAPDKVAGQVDGVPQSLSRVSREF